ncbi:MAG: hypothetical protein M3Q58_10045, partial [Bacteroidota bacterium]|nr:hypothetical protein [Bacteroidota bacterium]
LCLAHARHNHKEVENKRKPSWLIIENPCQTGLKDFIFKFYRIINSGNERLMILIILYPKILRYICKLYYK